MPRKINPIEKAVRLALKESRLSKVVATVSGGPDSVALVAALSDVAGIEIIALHCNFHLRGKESIRDQKSVESICSRLNVNLMVKDFDIPAFKNSHKGISTEMACRELRYEWFRKVKADSGADRIATGHNANDNAETLLLNLLRGSGTSGLKGMLPDNGEILRPLLSISRKEILDYLKERDLPYVIDSTNLQSDYRRNFLRNEIIPLLRTKWEGLDTSLARTLSHLRDENRIIIESVAASLPAEGEPLRANTVMNFPAPELLIRKFIEPAIPFSTTSSEILSAIKAAKPDVKIWRLRNGEVRLQGGKIYLFLKNSRNNIQL